MSKRWGTEHRSVWALAVWVCLAWGEAGAVCLTPLAPDEPLCNDALSDGPWPISHRGPYAQGSSALPGPSAGQTITAEHVDLNGPPITLAFSPQYTDGEHAIWGAELGLTNAVFKLDSATFTRIDEYVPADEETDPPAIPLGVSGAYSFVDGDFNFILGRSNFIDVFRDSIAGDRSSAIELAKRVFLPSTAFCRESDLLVGGVMLPDGYLAFVTEQAVVGVIPTGLADMDAGNVVSLPSENGADCDDELIPDEDLETVSNSIAADENGGIYVVSDRAVSKYSWDGTSLTTIWRAAYESDPPFSVLRLGPGSGSTPSLMGTDLDDDRFVVITDGQELMHLVLMWRDEIPADWQPIAAGKDPRIACEIPVTFGDPTSTRSLSEQSVLVRGNSAVVVSNLLSDESAAQSPVPALASALAALEGGNPEVAPFGIERFDWDPLLRTCRSVWTNREISLPNAIPTMSDATGLMYAIGQRDGVWGLEAIDFGSGASVLFAPSSQTTCSQDVVDRIAASPLGAILSPVVERLPASCENSIYAATEVGPDGTIYTGTFQGASRFIPSEIAGAAERRRALAGVGHGVDLANRGILAAAGEASRARDATERALRQLDETLSAIAATASELDSSSAAGAQASVDAARAHFVTAENVLDSDASAAQAELDAALIDLAEAADWLTPCPPAPQSGCRVATGAKLAVRTGASGRDRLVWKWRSSADIDPAVIPDPTDSADFALCLYSGGDADRAGAFVLPAGSDGWEQRRRGDGIQYRDRSASVAGVRKVLVREQSGKALARVRARSAQLGAPAMPLEGPVVAQFVNGESGLCWEATFDGDGIKKSTSTHFRGIVR